LLQAKRFHFTTDCQICFNHAAHGSRDSMTKTASGSDGWKNRGCAMSSIRISALLLAGVLMAGEAAAQGPVPPPQPATPAPPLPPAGPAPRQQAQNVGRPLLYWAAGGAAIIAGVILVAQDNDDTVTTTSTTGTN
jgi:hypothetical protein